MLQHHHESAPFISSHSHHATPPGVGPHASSHPLPVRHLPRSYVEERRETEAKSAKDKCVRIELTGGFVIRYVSSGETRLTLMTKVGGPAFTRSLTRSRPRPMAHPSCPPPSLAHRYPCPLVRST